MEIQGKHVKIEENLSDEKLDEPKTEKQQQPILIQEKEHQQIIDQKEDLKEERSKKK